MIRRVVAIAGASLVPCILVCGLAAQGSGRAATGSPAPGPTKAACRTYDTSARSVTVSGGVTTTLTFSGAFDPTAHRSTQNVNYEDTRGIRFSYLQVSEYQSLEDFIGEVGQLKAPVAIATAAPGPSLYLVPPLTRAISFQMTGGLTTTVRNSYDASHRLLRVVSTTPAGSLTTTYSAWDAFGRPTVGGISGPQTTSRLVLAYDDNARTLTTTTTTGSLAVIGTQTFDAYGNARLYVQRTNAGEVSRTTTTSLASASVCVGDKNTPDVKPLAPVGPSPNGTFAATIGGKAWSAATGVKGTLTGQVLAVGGGDQRLLVSVAASVNHGPGGYTAGLMDPPKFQQVPPDKIADALDRNSAVATVFDIVTKQSWQAGPTLGDGTVTVTALSSTGASGTFTLTLVPVPGTGASGSLSMTGTFNVRF